MRSAAAAPAASDPGPAIRRLALPAAARRATLDSRLAQRRGPVDVWVSLDEPSLASFKSARLEGAGIETQVRALASPGRETTGVADRSIKAAQRQHRDVLRSSQDGVMGQLRGMGAQELGRVVVAHNAVAVKVDASALSAIAQLPGVAAVRPVLRYKLALSETVPYVGAAAAQALGFDGTGVRVAVLDSGVDYTHRNLGGAGTPEAYAQAYGFSPDDPGNTRRDGFFPTAKVVDGFDFVGEAWPFGERTEDDDPIDAHGHGTAVADILAGRSADGHHKGVAPGASLVALKVCSAVASECNGIALLKALDYALDPNGDGDTSDAVDVINMSLGTDYGQEEDELTQASANAVRLGVVVVAAAGNASNRPYIVSSPSVARGVISVAQTVVPSDHAYPVSVNSPSTIAGSYANTAVLDWAPVGNGFSGTVAVVGQGCPFDGATPEDPYLESPAGKVALIDRGGCNISVKVDRATRAGAVGVLIGLIGPGDAVSYSLGGGSVFVPSLVIQQSLSDAIKANQAAPVTVTVSPTGLSLTGSMVSTSARGPSISQTAIKPEIGAPGGSVAAVVASGVGEEKFGGTSGATPMVAGAAAILIQAFPTRSAEQIKALLMNSAETSVYTNKVLLPDQPAPVTRIGAGELRVDRALKLTASARDRRGASSALSFGFHSVTGTTVLEKKLLIENFSPSPKFFSVRRSFRNAADEASGAVRIHAPSNVWVAGHGRQQIDVTLTIDGRKLPDWNLDGGPRGGSGDLLDSPEFDGYLTLSAGSETLSVPWHVLPRKASDMHVHDARIRAGQDIVLRNSGVAQGGLEVFSLTGVSPRVPRGSLPSPGDGFAVIDMRAVGVRLAQPGILQFAINTHGRRAHPGYPAQFQVNLDVNRDGIDDFIAYNIEYGGFAESGTNVVNLYDLATGETRAYYYIDADFQSANAILTVPTEALRIGDDTSIDFTVTAFDDYFTGLGTDAFGKMRYTPTAPRFSIAGTPVETLAARSSVRLETVAVPGGAQASPSQTGFLLMYRLDAGKEADIVLVR